VVHLKIYEYTSLAGLPPLNDLTKISVDANLLLAAVLSRLKVL
jgi:hypothetical protein